MISESQRRRYKQAKLAYQAFIKLYPLGLDDLDGEEWRDIKGYEGGYKVSNFGRVKSFKRKITRILKPSFNNGGYLWVALCKRGVTKNFCIHRLVAEAFIPNPKNLPEINHIDISKFNCHVDNLEWTNHKDNIQHAVNMGLMNSAQGGEQVGAKLTNEAARYVRNNPDGLTGVELAKKFGVRPSIIYNIQKGKTYKTAGGKIRETKRTRTPDEIRAKIRAEYKPCVRGYGTQALAKKYGLSRATIYEIVKGEGRQLRPTSRAASDC